MLILKVLTSNSVLFNPLVFIFFVEKKDKEEREREVWMDLVRLRVNYAGGLCLQDCRNMERLN